MAKSSSNTGQPKFPYTTQPKALRRLLQEIPNRPKPPKMTLSTLKSWNVLSTNDTSPIGVLKKIGFVGQAGDPTGLYTDFMRTGTGPAVLADRVRDVYRVLFESSHAPQSEPDDELKKLFHIHSGGGDDAMRYQIQTFKVLSDYSNFATAPEGTQGTTAQGTAQTPTTRQVAAIPPIAVDLHIHLPENKTTRDYEAIIQDIARYIYGRDIQKS